MRLLIDLEEDGPITAEVVRENVERAILNWKANAGLSAPDDEGCINLIDVTIIEEDGSNAQVHGNVGSDPYYAGDDDLEAIELIDDETAYEVYQRTGDERLRTVM